MIACSKGHTDVVQLFLGAAILTYTFLKYTLSLCTKVYLILGVCTKVYLKNLANLDADTKVYLE